MGIIIAIGIVFFILIVASSSSKRGTGRSLQLKVRALDDVTQYSYDEIVAKLGLPNASARMAGGNDLVQWMASGYHVAMTFSQDNKCLGIDSEIAV